MNRNLIGAALIFSLTASGTSLASPMTVPASGAQFHLTILPSSLQTLGATGQSAVLQRSSLVDGGKGILHNPPTC